MAPSSIKLKNLKLPTVLQSPMANCSDLPFRLIARSCGMRFAYLEMISSEALVRDVKRTYELMQTVPEDRPLGAQLVGCDPSVMGEAAAKIESLGFDLVDMNLGCPVPKIVSNGGGSKLLKEPERARQIFLSVVRAVKHIPVTVKMRIGFSDKSGEEAVHIAKIAEDCGVDAVAVHGRTREQGYSGIADYEAIRRVKEAVSIPVIGNGDVIDGESAVRLRDVSGCDGIMLARGALGNPWIYKQVEAALENRSRPALPDFETRRRMVLKHIELQEKYEAWPVGPLRRIVSWYFKDHHGAAKFRGEINKAQSVKEICRLVEEFNPAAA